MLNRNSKSRLILASLILAAVSPLVLARAVRAADPVYDCGDYGAGDYSDNCASGETVQGGGSGSDGGGILSGSGERIALYSTLSLICVGGAIYLLVRARRTSAEAGKTTDDDTHS